MRERPAAHQGGTLRDKPSPQAVWRKSSRCGTGNCVEVFTSDFIVRMRDGKDPSGPVLEFDFRQWSCFLSTLRDPGFGA
ncbi:DUF397 domain-containing protein [Actinoplanes sp. NPDC051859]|uniref:DUF397 domain-containing protein n=1 Tax=Actinoplanes sp. NPDC051859 TaxID=3363909 RepID=UPI0037967FB0